MQAYVYKSQRKADTFVFLAKQDDFECLPEPMRAQLAPFSWVMELAITPERKLARGNTALVREQLSERGFHIQFPPQPLVDESSDA